MLFALILLWLNLLEGKATICLLKPLVLKTFGFLDHSGRNYAILTSDSILPFLSKYVYKGELLADHAKFNQKITFLVLTRYCDDSDCFQHK